MKEDKAVEEVEKRLNTLKMTNNFMNDAENHTHTTRKSLSNSGSMNVPPPDLRHMRDMPLNETTGASGE